MNDAAPIRKPKQKRSKEKKSRIIKAGFELFCAKGYYGTNTTEIADAAGVSTGTVYSYFKDKKAIYIAAFDDFFDVNIMPLLSELENTPKPIDIQIFIDKCIVLFSEMFGKSKQALNELGYMQGSDPEIMEHFSKYEDAFLSAFSNSLHGSYVDMQSLNEKVFILYILVEAIATEQTYHYHNFIDIDVMKKEATKVLSMLFSRN